MKKAEQFKLTAKRVLKERQDKGKEAARKEYERILAEITDAANNGEFSVVTDVYNGLIGAHDPNNALMEGLLSLLRDDGFDVETCGSSPRLRIFWGDRLPIAIGIGGGTHLGGLVPR